MTALPFRISITPSGKIQGAGPLPLVGIPATLAFVTGDEAATTISTPTIVPLQPVSAQVFDVSLNNQNCTIRILFRDLEIPAIQEIVTNPPFTEPLTVGFLDLEVNNSLIIGGVRCTDRNVIVRNKYLGFVGDLSFIDLQGTSDPLPAGLGTRWLLTYWPDLA